MHGQQAVEDHHRRAGDGEFMRQSLNLAVELVQRESPTQVQATKAGFHITSQRLQKGNECEGQFDRHRPPSEQLHPEPVHGRPNAPPRIACSFPPVQARSVGRVGHGRAEYAAGQSLGADESILG